MKALLVLSDGTVYEGASFGASGETVGEVVFNTSLTGYQEILTDPSYRGQIVTMTCPHIGNYGVNPEDVESDGPALSGFIVKEACAVPSNWRSRKSLDAYLKEQGIVGICGIDTRALTRRLRDFGAQEGVISTVDSDTQSLVRKAKSSPGLIGRDLVREVTCTQPYRWIEGVWQMRSVEVGIDNVGFEPRTAHSAFAGQFRVVAYDFGIKRNILRMLVSAGCDVTVVPAHTSAAEVLGMHPDGLVLSNGPGDPEGVPYAIQNIRELVGKIPIFGICLGHQILGLALGGKTYKLKFGHHGGNQPVMDLATRKVEITAQNHGFAVDVNSIGGEVELTHINLNDQTVEGMRHKRLPIFSVQYHPEASPGPHDSGYLFQRFTEMMMADYMRINFPKLFELYSEAKNKRLRNNFFSELRTKDLRNSEFREIEEDLSSLDEVSWTNFKSKLFHKINKNEQRGYEKLVDYFNEAKAYCYLKNQGFTTIEFIPESRNRNMETPDMRVIADGKTILILEVKTINSSDDEIDFINDNTKVIEIMKCMEKVETSIHDMTFEQFVKDEKTKDTVIRNLKDIGEAVKNISNRVEKKSPKVNWRAVAGMRDKLIHEYFGVSLPIVWETIKNDLPPFRCEIEKIVIVKEVKLEISIELQEKIRDAICKAKSQLLSYEQTKNLPKETLKKVVYLIISLDYSLSLDSRNIDEIRSFLREQNNGEEFEIEYVIKKQ